MNPCQMSFVESWDKAQEWVIEELRVADVSSHEKEKAFLLHCFNALEMSPYGIGLMREASEKVSPFCFSQGLKVPHQGYYEAMKSGDSAQAGKIIYDAWQARLDSDLTDFYSDAQDELKQEKAA